MKCKSRRVVVVATAVVSVAIAGCDSLTTTTSESSSASSTVASETTSPPRSSAPAPANDATVVDINIASGAVTPTNGQVQGTVGKPIVLNVSSDVADQLHVHSVPENTFQVEPRPGQQFQFTVDVPGQVDIELHDLNRTVVTVQVRP